MIHHAWLATVLAALLLNMAACQNGASPNKRNYETDSLSMAAENQVEVAAEAGDIKRTTELADSFVNQNLLSSVRADFYKAMACNRIENYPAMAEHIRKIIKAYEDGSDEDPLFYSRAAISLAGHYISMNQHEEAMNVAMPALARFEPDPTIQSDWKGIFLSYIGACQKKLNQPEEAKKNFEQAYQYYKKYMGEERFKPLDFLTCITDLYNISMYYASKETLKEEQMWNNRCDSLLAWYRIQPGADSAHVEMMDGLIALRRAHILLDQGKKAEADKAFEAFLKTKYSKGNEGRLITCGYLSSVGRYAEAADIYQDYDRIAAEWGLKPNLDVIKDYLFTKFNINYKAGRKDSALAVAVKIASVIDSAVIKQMDNQAAELATIYETQKKEAQIARQQTELSHQRMIGLIVAIIALIVFFVIIDIYRRRSAKRLAKVNAAKERMESELSIARNIQMSMVPHTFPEREDLDMYAMMTPAKEVGGDLYSYLIQGDILYFCVGDVSGKGVPASLFMAQTTRLFHTLASQGMAPAEICTHMNDELTEDNEQCMFVTIFICKLNIRLHSFEYCNAGHNPPVIGNADGQFSFLEMNSNACIGLWPGLKFVGESIDYFKDRMLLIYTDGLNEAENSQQEQFGEERILELLKQTQSASARQVVETLAEAVSQHRNGAEPNDDLTMMCVSMKKQQVIRKEIKLRNQVEELERVLQFIEEIGDDLGLDMELVMNLKLVMEEMVSNVIFYAYPKGTEGTIELSVDGDEKELTFLLSDQGYEFDPTLKADPDLDVNPAERRLGDMGIFIVKNIMDSVTYQRLEGKNLLTMKKNIGNYDTNT